jgi:hypothetical protein
MRETSPLQKLGQVNFFVPGDHAFNVQLLEVCNPVVGKSEFF